MGAETGQRRRVYTLAGLSVGLAVISGVLTPGAGPESLAPHMTAVAVLMALWWVFEIVPIPVTALLPLVLLPLLGIADLKAVSASYGKPIIFLFLGGFLLALGLQRSGLHRRIALGIVSLIGSQPRRLVLGFMVATYVLSMWISNTASVMVMLPIALSVLSDIRERGDEHARLLGPPVMLGIAYAADIGGRATPVGTPPNLVFMEVLGDLFPAIPPPTFAQWMIMGVPLSVVFLFAGWYLLAWRLFPLPTGSVTEDGDAVRDALRHLGPLSRDEAISGAVFAATALLWITGSDLRLGADLQLPGWRTLLHVPEVGDAAVAVAAGVSLFLIPSRARPGEALMDWKATRDLPWGMLLLFGGGFALAGGFQSSGLSAIIGSGLAGLSGLPVVALVVVVCVVLTFLTELTSNTAMTTLMMPILAQAAVELSLDPRLLMIPATLSASCAFMMPVASPTQAIVFGSGHVTIRQMVRAGIWFNLLGILIVTVAFFLVGVPTLGIRL
ncbi:MAG: DASS family sodium-coupled anion symporter [Candidatus Poribacteria bacterium]